MRSNGLLDVLIIGTGAIAMRHASNLMRLENVGVTLLSRTRRRPDSILSGCGFMFDPERRADLSRFTHAIVASQTCFHLSDLQQCLGKISSIYLEKPAYISAELIEPVIDEFVEQGGFFYHGFMTRHHPSVEYAISWIRRQEARVMSAHFSIGQKLSSWRPVHANDDFVSYSYDRAKGGIVYFDLIHELDLLLAFFGPVAEAIGVSRELKEKGSVRVASGDAICVHNNSVVSVVHLDSIDPIGHRSIRLLGDNLYFEANLLSGEVRHLVGGKLKTFGFESSRNNMFVDALDYFLAMSRLQGETRRQVAMDNREIALAPVRLAEKLSRQVKVDSLDENV